MPDPVPRYAPLTSFTRVTRLRISIRFSSASMARGAAGNWQPPRNSGGLRYQNQKGPKVNWKEEKDFIADDQIAPKHVAHSIHSLQEWARSTANFPHQGHGRREGEIIDRIQRRYLDPCANYNGDFPRYTNAHEDPANVQDRHQSGSYSRDSMHDSATKRRHSSSPPSIARAQQDGASDAACIRPTKRRRTRSPSLVPSYRNGSLAERMTIDLTEDDDDYAQSSEWSFPDSEPENEHEVIDLT